MQVPGDGIAFRVSKPATPTLPSTPKPSTDAGIATVLSKASRDSGFVPEDDELDVFTLRPLAALKMLCGTIETLVQMTGDVPPTPPISQPSTPHLGTLGDEKDIVACQAKESSQRKLIEDTRDVDGVPARAKTPIGSPEAHPSEPLRIVGRESGPIRTQRGAIARKFYSKKPPPIALEQYLLRLHEYCPMSTAVYIATSLYIHRLAVVERSIPVTARNVHRLVLAGLRVAMKALEDQSYPHRRFAKVGGVSEPELGRLEISFCFITNFELRVNAEMLLEHAKGIRYGTIMYDRPFDFQAQLPPPKEKEKGKETDKELEK